MLFTVREKVLNNFKSRLFPIKNQEPELELQSEPESEPERNLKYRKLSLNSHKEFLNEIVNEEKNLNIKTPSSLVKDLLKVEKNKNDKI